VVAPSLPGFAFSGPTRETGWNLPRIANAFAELMHGLGSTRYGAQGGDVGAVVSPELGRLDPSTSSASTSTTCPRCPPATRPSWPTSPLPSRRAWSAWSDQLLTNITIYWVTGTAGSSARRYREGASRWGHRSQRSPVPTGVAVFPGDIAIRRFAQTEHTIAHWSELDRGGHFAAMEAPDLLTNDIQTFIHPLR
jgi:pimeloyl-ACP methyl ester carboxylesterase